MVTLYLHRISTPLRLPIHAKVSTDLGLCGWALLELTVFGRSAWLFVTISSSVTPKMLESKRFLAPVQIPACVRSDWQGTSTCISPRWGDAHYMGRERFGELNFVEKSRTLYGVLQFGELGFGKESRTLLVGGCLRCRYVRTFENPFNMWWSRQGFSRTLKPGQ